MKKCAIIVPYFGTNWPVWFPLYLHSLEQNKEVLDVLFITNIAPLQNHPENAIFQYSSFENYCDFVTNKLNIDFHPDSPYKLCDLKPFLPVIHADELKEYEYLGFGDIDLIYGDLSKWLNNIPKSKKMISTHVDRVSGHLALLKNTPKNLKKVFKIPKWKDILQENNHRGIDEGRFSFVHFPLLYVLSCVVQYKLKKPKLGKGLCKTFKFFYPSIYLKELNTTPLPKVGEEWSYNHGKIADPLGREIPYLHFLFFKKSQYNPNNQNYWKDGFFKIDPKEDFSKCPIIIDTKGIGFTEKDV